MKKYMDKLSRNIRINKNLFIFLLVIVIIGITAGALFTAIISTEDKELVTSYLNDFITNIKEGKLIYENSLINALILTIGVALIIWLLGVSVIGFIVVIVILFLKAFVLGFSVGSIIATFKVKGILLAFIYSFPHQVINILVFMLISAFALIMSFKIINSITSKKPLDLKHFMNRYLIILIFSCLVLLISSLYEIYVVPKLINFVMSILKW